MGADMSLDGRGMPTAADLEQMGCCSASRQPNMGKFDDKRGLPSSTIQAGQAGQPRFIPEVRHPYLDQRGQQYPPAAQGHSRSFAPEVPAHTPPTPPRPQISNADSNVAKEQVKTELKRSKSVPTKEVAPQQKVRQWLSKYDSERTMTQDRTSESNSAEPAQPANRDTSLQASEARTKLRSASQRGFDDPDLISRPSRTPVGQGRADAPSEMGRVSSAAFNMGQVPQAKFSIDRTDSSKSRRAPPADGAWFADPEGKVVTPEPPVVLPAADKSPKTPRHDRERERERERDSGYDDPDIISRPSRAPMGRSGSKKELQDPKQTSIGRTGYNTLKVAVAHLKNTRKELVNPLTAKNPYGAVNSSSNKSLSTESEVARAQSLKHVSSLGSSKTASKTRLF